MMGWLYDSKIRNKLFAGFGLIVLMVVSVAVIGARGLKVVSGHMVEMHDEHFNVALTLAQAGTKLSAVRSTLLGMLVAGDRETQEKLNAQIKDLTEEIDGSFELLLSGPLSGELKAGIREVQETWRAFRDTRDRELIPAIYAGRLEEARGLAAGIQAERYRSFSSEAARLIDEAQERAARFKEEAQARYASSVIFFFGLTGFSVFLAIAMAFFFNWVIATPVGQAVEVLEAVAKGDFTRRLNIDTRDEVGRMAAALNRTAEALDQKNKQLSLLHRQVAVALTSSLSLNDVLNQIMSHGISVSGAKATCIAFYDESSGRFKEWLTQGLSDHFVENMSFRPGGLADETFTSGTYVLSNDHPETKHKLSRLAREEGIRAFICLPLIGHEQELGVIYFYRDDRDTFTPNEIELLTTFAHLAAGAIDNSRLFEEAQSQRVRLTQIFDSANDAIISADSDGRIIAWNKGAQAIFGWSEKEVWCEPLTLLIPERYREAHQRGVKRVRSGGEPRIVGTTVELHGLRKDGGEFPLELSLTSWKTREGAFYTAIVRDITERKRMEQMKSDFVSFATHQLRTPLAGIKWLLELAAQEPELPDGARSYIQDTRDSAERLIGLVNDLLDISRLENGKLAIALKETDLHEMTSSVLDEVKILVEEKGHQLSFAGDGEVPPVQADPQLLRQVVLNLVSNAIKYTPPGGKMEVWIEREDSSVLWAIRDNGIGIPKGAQGRLFEKFYRADNAQTIHTEGTGLGLYLARLIVERLGGRIWCESEEGEGTTFLFKLPLSE